MPGRRDPAGRHVLVWANEINRAAIAFGYLAFGIGKAAGTDADKFEVEFPADANTNAKARLLGALFLINQLFFEGGD